MPDEQDKPYRTEDFWLSLPFAAFIVAALALWLYTALRGA